MENTLVYGVRQQSAAAAALWRSAPLPAQAKAVSRSACHRTSQYPAPVVDVGYPANTSVKTTHYWHSGQIPKNSRLCVTAWKPFLSAMRLSISSEKHSSISTTWAQRVHTR